MKKKLLCKIEELYRSQCYRQAIKKIDQLLQIDPDSLEGYFIRGRSFMKMKRYPEAISDFTYILQHEPDHGGAKAGRSLSYGMLNKMDRILAKSILDDAIKKNPEDTALLQCRATMNHHNGNLKEAIEEYSHAIQNSLEPQDQFYFYRGELYLELGDYDLAICDFNEALKSNLNKFNHPFLYYNRAKAFIEKGEPEKAELDILRAIRIIPDFEDFQELASKIAHRSLLLPE
jgi:tetratricopeptide (TPR) repeat protein